MLMRLLIKYCVLTTGEQFVLHLRVLSSYILAGTHNPEGATSVYS